MKMKNSELELLVFNFCFKSKVKMFIDIGSNRPKNGETFLKQHSAANFQSNELTYLGFEANPVCFSYYFEERPENFIFSNVALGDRNGFTVLNIPFIENTASRNSFHDYLRIVDRKIFKNYHANLDAWFTANNLGGSEKRHLTSYKKFKVPIVRLDSLVPCFEEKTILWIDVEGSTPEVLRGAGNLLISENLLAVFIESEYPVNTERDWTELESHKILLNAGLKMKFYSELHNALYVRDLLDKTLNTISSEITESPRKERRHRYKLRLKSLFFSGDKLLKKWEN